MSLISFLLGVLSGLVVGFILYILSRCRNKRRLNSIIKVVKKAAWCECSTDSGSKCGISNPVGLKFLGNAQIDIILLYKKGKEKATYGLIPYNREDEIACWGTDPKPNNNSFLPNGESIEIEKYYNIIKICVSYNDFSNQRRFVSVILDKWETDMIIDALYRYSVISNPQFPHLTLPTHT